jgi:hypothetical protein
VPLVDWAAGFLNEHKTILGLASGLISVITLVVSLRTFGKTTAAALVINDLKRQIESLQNDKEKLQADSDALSEAEIAIERAQVIQTFLREANGPVLRMVNRSESVSLKNELTIDENDEVYAVIDLTSGIRRIGPKIALTESGLHFRGGDMKWARGIQFQETRA